MNRTATGLTGSTALIFALAALAGVIGLAALWSAFRDRAGGHGPRAAGASSRWATHGELAPLRRSFHRKLILRLRRLLWGSANDGDQRIGLGRHGGRMLYAEARHALIAFGPPQSGKSAGLAIPALLEWNGPAVASSIKGDLLAATLTRRAQLGEAMVFDPFGLSGVESMTWSPLHGATTWDGALEVAWRIASAGELDHRSVEGGDFWAIAAEQRLAPLLFLGARTGRSIETVVAWAYGQGHSELESALRELLDSDREPREWTDVRRAHEAIRGFDQQADRTRSSIEATVQSLLRAYRFTRVAKSASSCEITADRLLAGSGTLYLVGDAKASKLLRPLMVALLGEIVDRAYELAGVQGGSLKHPLLLCLDEAGNVAPLPNLAEIASTAPSHGIQLISIFHDLTQARSRYSGQAETVVNSHRARMLLPGVADLETLRYFAALIGDGTERETTRTSGSGGRSQSYASHRAPLIATDALRRLDEGEAVLLYGRLAPVRVRLRLWFRDRRLRALQSGRARPRTQPTASTNPTTPTTPVAPAAPITPLSTTNQGVEPDEHRISRRLRR